MPKTIGIRGAKAELSRLLKEVEQGVEWIITDRGTPVAKLGPIPREERTLSDRLRMLEQQGLIEPAPEGVRKLPPPLPLADELAQRWLQEGRDR